MRLILCLTLAGCAVAQPPARSRSASSTVVIRNGGSYLGVAVVEIEAERAKALKLREERGVEVKVVDEGSPAAKAGLKPDDAVLEFNGQRIEGTSQFVRMVAETPAGRKVSLGVVRAGALLTLNAVLEARVGRQMALSLPLDELPPLPPLPPMPDLPRANMSWRTGTLGIESEALNSQMANYFGVKQGVLVRMVTHDSPAERAGLKAGDVIVKTEGRLVAATRDISTLLNGRTSVTLGIVRNHLEINLGVLLN